MTPREYFESVGKLKPSTNKPHEFQIGRLMCNWQMAEDTWVGLTDKGILQTNYLSLHKAENVEGGALTCFIIWRFSIMFAIISKNKS